MASSSVSAESLAAFSRIAMPTDEPEVALDDQTWSDLDMDAVSARIDRTVSAPGRMVLHRLLRWPTSSLNMLAERDALIEALAPERASTQRLRQALERLDGLAGAEDLMRLLWEALPSPLPFAWAHRLLAVFAAASLPLALVYGGPAVFAPIAVFAVNAAIHFRARLQWQWEIQALRFVGALRACAGRIATIDDPALGAHRGRLQRAHRGSGAVARRTALLSGGGVKDLLYEYVNVFFLLELRSYQWSVRHWSQARPWLRELFLALGELDAFASVARWRSETEAWCRPELTLRSPRLEMVDGIHPLLEAPVPNSVALSERGCLITGANMSGKSTFLRVVGVNMLLAQTVFTATARRFSAAPMRVISSMRVGDALLEGRSRYLAEAERLLAIVRLADAGPQSLCLIDELLSGTNAAERLAASHAILVHLVQRGMLVLAATHDLELTERLAGHFDSYFFADDFARDDLRFDHRLQRGVANTRNALRLLEMLGYPEEILALARNSEIP